MKKKLSPASNNLYNYQENSSTYSTLKIND
uniref:Uncharacterized protein n=1 Tax=Arundo donax TaxID=35708 RepID=A0A0A9EVZ4_ARUDO